MIPTLDFTVLKGLCMLPVEKIIISLTKLWTLIALMTGLVRHGCWCNSDLNTLVQPTTFWIKSCFTRWNPYMVLLLGQNLRNKHIICHKREPITFMLLNWHDIELTLVGGYFCPASLSQVTYTCSTLGQSASLLTQ